MLRSHVRATSWANAQCTAVESFLHNDAIGICQIALLWIAIEKVEGTEGKRVGIVRPEVSEILLLTSRHSQFDI